MAVVKNPFLSTDARGSLSGLTASFSRGGITVRRKSKPSKGRIPKQSTNRSILGFVSRQWGKLSDDNRADWEAYALDHPGVDRFGDPFIMSGINAFMMLNHKAIRLWNASHYRATPPADDPVSAVFVLSAEHGATNPGDIDLSWTELGTGLVTDYYEIWMAGPFQSPGKVSVGNRYSWLKNVSGNVLLSTVIALAEGFWYWFQVRYIDEFGQTTAWVTAQATPKATP